jgi:uncharacterized protein CbrC (UPF0167 family)
MMTPSSGSQGAAASYAASWAKNYMRVAAPGSSSMLDELGQGLLNLTLSLQCVEHALKTDIEAFTAAAMQARLREVLDVAEALEQVYVDAADVRVAAILQPDASLAEYLRGVLAWTQGIVRAFDDLVLGLKKGAPAWSQFDRRLADAASFYFDDLAGSVREELIHRGLGATPIQQHVERLVRTASFLGLTLCPR